MNDNVRRKTGISVKQLKTWLHNHKSRHLAKLQEFNRLISEGKIEGYDDFLNHRKMNTVRVSRHYGKDNDYNNNNNRVTEINRQQSTGSSEPMDSNDDDTVTSSSSVSDDNNTCA